MEILLLEFHYINSLLFKSFTKFRIKNSIILIKFFILYLNIYIFFIFIDGRNYQIYGAGNRLSQNDLSDYSNYGEYGPPNHNRGKLIRQLEMTPTPNFINIKRSSKYGNIRESQN